MHSVGGSPAMLVNGHPPLSEQDNRLEDGRCIVTLKDDMGLIEVQSTFIDFCY
jgi:hypothetical protein